MNRLALGLIIMFCSTILVSTGTIGIKSLQGAANSWQLVSIRGLWGIAVALILARFRFSDFKVNALGWLLALGASSTLAITCLVKAVTILPLSVAMPIFYLYPAMGAIISPILNKEKAGPLDWLAIVLGFVGTFVLVRGVILGAGYSLPGLLLAFGAAFGVAMMANLARHQRYRGYPAHVLIFYTYLVNFLICLPVLLISSGGANILPPAAALWPLNTWVIPAMIFGLLLMYQAYRYLTAFQGSLVLSCELAFVVLYGFFVLHEEITKYKLVGILFLALSVLIMTLGKSERFRGNRN